MGEEYLADEFAPAAGAVHHAPGGFENLVIAMSEPAASRTLPPPSAQEPDWERIAAIAREHGAELLG
jgi:hypothetical protein